MIGKVNKYINTRITKNKGIICTSASVSVIREIILCFTHYRQHEINNFKKSVFTLLIIETLLLLWVYPIF